MSSTLQSSLNTAAERLRNIAQHVTSPLTNSIAAATATATISAPPNAIRVHHHPLSPAIFLPRAAAIESEAPAIVHTTAAGKEIRWTYGVFAERTRGLTYYFKQRGYKRIGILAPNTPAFLETIFAAAAAGAAHVGVNFRLSKDDVHYILDHADVDVVVIDREFISLLDGFKPEIPVIVDEDADEISGDFNRIILEGQFLEANGGAKGWDGLNVVPNDEEDLLAIPYTSGTTARPKGVEYTHRGSYLAAMANIAESGLNSQHVLGHNRCRYLWTLWVGALVGLSPLFHATGWTFPWAVTAVRGTHYCLRKVDYDLIWNLLVKEKITHACFAPTVGTLLTASPKAKRLDQELRVAVAASPPTANMFRSMIALNMFPVHVYGMTETYGPFTRNYYMDSWNDISESERYERMARQGHSFLTANPVRVIKQNQLDNVLIDIKKDGKDIGEIVFCGNICARGYYKDPIATQKLFSGGVLHSGDLAVWHEDGSVQILDREKDIIISGGENISSVALENALSKHPEILEVGVVGIADEKWGERCKAYITTRNKAQVKEEDVIEWARQQDYITRFMVPAYVEVVDELPKTSTGKLKKNVLREWAKTGKNIMT